jgi:HEAT repeat protein
MVFIFAASIILTTAPLGLKNEAARFLNLESYKEAALVADTLKNFEDPEALYLAASSYAASGDILKAIDLVESKNSLLKESKYYRKALESLSLSMFKTHFKATQEPIKMASLAALAQEPDHRVLSELLEAFDHPSLKIKMLALRGLSSFPDEKVKLFLLDRLKLTNHPVVSGFIAKLFAHWQDKRIVPILHRKLNEDALSLEEKIGYILALKEMADDYSLDEITEHSSSKSAARRLLACFLLSSSKCAYNEDLLLKLLSDHHLWVRQAAVLTCVKKKAFSQAVQDKVASFYEQKSFELKKTYFYYGLVAQNPECQKRFIQYFESSDIDVRKQLAAILTASGPEQDLLVEKILDARPDPYTRLVLGLYTLSGHEYSKGIQVVLQALKELEGHKIFALSDPILPIFTLEDEGNSHLSMTAGQRRIKDKHLRLQLFHLLAIKKHPEAKSVLKDLLKTDLFEISLDAMMHFWEHFGWEDRDYLKEILEDNDPELRLKAALVLSYLDYDKTARTTLMKTYHKQNYSMQIQMLFALSKYHEEDVIDFYFKQLKSKYPLIQAVSAGCLFTALYK